MLIRLLPRTNTAITTSSTTLLIFHTKRTESVLKNSNILTSTLAIFTTKPYPFAVSEMTIATKIFFRITLNITRTFPIINGLLMVDV